MCSRDLLAGGRYYSIMPRCHQCHTAVASVPFDVSPSLTTASCPIACFTTVCSLRIDLHSNTSHIPWTAYQHFKNSSPSTTGPITVNGTRDRTLQVTPEVSFIVYSPDKETLINCFSAFQS